MHIVINLIVLKFVASGSEVTGFIMVRRAIVTRLGVFKYVLPSWALARSYKQCLMFTSQFTILKVSHSA